LNAAYPDVSLIRLPGSEGGLAHLTRGWRRAPGCEVVHCAVDRPVAHAVARSTGSFVAFVTPGDTVNVETLAEARRVAAGADVDVVYTDEASRDGRVDPFFKPGWSPERLLGHNYIGRLTLLRRSLVLDVGGIRDVAASGWEYDLVLRVTAAARRVEHVPAIGYRRRRDLALDGAEAVADDVLGPHLRTRGLPAVAEPDPNGRTFRVRPRLTSTPLVSIVIPTGGRRRRVRGETLDLVANAVESVVGRSTYPNLELVVVADPTVEETTRRRLRAAAGDRLRLVEYTEPFNFAHKINVGVLHSRGEYVLLLNDDTAVRNPGWIESLLLYALDPGIGAVGAFLRFGDGRYQHVGVVAIGGNPGHPYYGFPADYPGYHDNVVVPANYLAVTGACLMTRRAAFEQVGGLSTAFPSNYNDVDYCLKLRQVGLRTVWTPDAELFHYETSSREPGPVAQEELDRLRGRWRPALYDDPYYSPNFLPTADFLVPLGAGR
jgi:GT2 family glycosyltransferase